MSFQDSGTEMHPFVSANIKEGKLQTKSMGRNAKRETGDENERTRETKKRERERNKEGC